MAVEYLAHMFSLSLIDYPSVFPVDFIILILLFIIFEWISREKLHPLEFKTKKKGSSIYRPIIVSLIIWIIILWGAFGNKEFIYFQF